MKVTSLAGVSSPLSATVISAQWEQNVAKRIVLQRTDTKPWNFLPGQHLYVAIQTPTETLWRPYSIASAPDHQHHLHLLVKDVPHGVGSHYLCHNVQPGQKLSVQAPRGQFTPHRFDVPMLFVGAGSGVTPLLSMFAAAQQAAQHTRHFLFVDQSPAVALGFAQLQDQARHNPERTSVAGWWSDESGFITAEDLRRIFENQRDADVYFCGPSAFCDVVEQAATLAELDPKRVFSEPQ